MVEKNGTHPVAHLGTVEYISIAAASSMSVRKHHDEMTVYAARPEQGHPDGSVAPVHYHGFTLRYRMEDEKEYRTVVSTRLHHTLFFEREDEGRRVCFTAAWMNPRLEPGPWSGEISEVVG
jgi:hypothetical protein